MLPLANIFQPLIDVFKPVLVFFHDSVGLGWGWAIVALTICVRALLLPLAIKQYRSMKALQEIAPELKKVQERYKDDKQRQQQEVMKFYQENKVNPLASCLPLILQLPVFLSLYYMLRTDLKHEICGIPIADAANQVCEQVQPGSGQFLFIPDLTDKATGGVLVVLIVLYVSSQLLSSILMPATVDKTQRMIFMALPFIFVPFIIQFPAGLIVYWITTNLWTVSQQTALRKIMGAPKPPPLNADGTRPGPFDEILKQFRKPPAAEQPSNGGKGGKGGGGEKAARKRQPAGVSSGGGGSSSGKSSGSGSGSGGGGGGGGTPREPGAKPPPPPRKRTKKRSGRRR
jgi:YidC/Oxa1 family membrane protein insertase